MSSEKFRPTHTLTWKGEQIDVAVTPYMKFKALEGAGKGGLQTPAYTRDEWRADSTADWTTDSQGNWYRGGRHVRPLVLKLS